MQEKFNIRLYLKICDARKAIGLPVDEKCESLARQCLHWKTLSIDDKDIFKITVCVESGVEELMQYIKEKYNESKNIQN